MGGTILRSTRPDGGAAPLGLQPVATGQRPLEPVLVEIVLDWTLENLSGDEVAKLQAIYEPLTESVRALIDATIRTEVGADAVAAAKAEIDAATARLRSEQVDGSYGIRFTSDGEQMPWGNVVI